MATIDTVLLDANARHREYTGVQKFHDAGYYGSGIIAASGESWSTKVYNPGGLVVDYFNKGFGGGHAVNTAATFFQVAPKAQLYMLPYSAYLYGSTPEKSYDEFTTKVIEAIREKHITAMFNSFARSYDKTTKAEWIKALESVKDYFKCFFSMGNDDDEKYNKITDIELNIGVAAYTIMVYGNIVPAGYSSEGMTVDFAAPSMIYTNISATKPNASAGPNTGTSFSGPWLCGMACLVDEFFIDKTGKPLSRDAMYRFFLDHCTDIGDEGFDIKMGHGAVRLPDPSEIDIEKYQESSVDTPVTDPDNPSGEDEETMTESQYKPINDTTLKSGVQLLEVPYESIQEVGYAQCKQPLESIKDWYSRQEDKPQIVVNGGLFNWSGGSNILSFIENGVEQNAQNNYEGIGTKKSNKALLVQGVDKDSNWWDFMSAYPVLVRDGVALDTFDKGNEINTAKRARTAVGVKRDGSILILTVDENPGMKFNEMAEILAEHGAWYAINHDGGGSVYKMTFGEVKNSPTENRTIDNVFYVKLKAVDDASTNPPVLDPAISIDPGMYYAAEEIEFKVGIDTSDDDPCKVLDTIPVGDQVEVRVLNPWNGKLWVNVEWNYQRGYIVYNGHNLVTELNTEEPEDPGTDDPMNPDFVPGIYRVNVAEGTYLSVRAEPSNDGELIGKLYRDDEVPILNIENDNWGKIATIDGVDMYINMNYVIRLEDYTDPTVTIPEKAKIGVCVRGEAGLALGTIVVIKETDEEAGTCTVVDSMIEEKYAEEYVVSADAITVLCEYNNEEADIPDKPEEPELPEDPDLEDDVLDCFRDRDEISPSYRDNVRLMVSLGIFMKDDEFRPKDALTREESAEVMGRLYKVITGDANNQ